MECVKTANNYTLGNQDKINNCKHYWKQNLKNQNKYLAVMAVIVKYHTPSPAF
jgi:hypothetical protein